MHGRLYEDEVLGKAYDARLVRRLLPFVWPYRRSMALALLLLFAIAGFDLAGPYLTKEAIDRFMAQGNADGLGPLAALYLGLVGLGALARYAQNYLLQSTGQRVMRDLRVAVFSHLQRLSLSFFDRNPAGSLMSRLNNDVEALNELLTYGVVILIGDITTLTAIAVVLFALNWQLALITFLVVPLLLVITQHFRAAMRDTYRAIRQRLAAVNAFLQESVSGMAVVQLFGRERSNFATFDALNRDLSESNQRAVFYFSAFFPSVSFVSALAVALIVWYGGGQVAQQALTLGALVAFIQYIDRFFLPIRDLAEKYNILQAAMAAAERIFGLLDEEVRVQNPAAPVPLPAVRGEIEFRGVSFAYNDQDFVLRDVSFHIAPGESVAIVGATGAGKTSIISLLLRFYDPQRGAVLLDGVDLRALDLAQLRRHIGVVLQDPFLFAGTIADNIRLRKAEISDEQVHAAAHYVNAAPFIERLPRGYGEELHERGAGLSVGQKQLIGLARAIAYNAEVLLILDEATSSVDGETERLIQEALARVRLNRTTIVIAHRLATIRDADRIVVLHRGRVVELGSHEELLARRGFYYRLYELQYHERAPFDSPAAGQG